MMSVCGTPCSGPILSCTRGAQPPISSTGTRASAALATAVTVLVTPGPAVAIATPRLPVSSAWAWAMCIAARSSRTSTMRMPACATRSQIGWIWPPCRPKTRSTPRALRARAIQAATLVSSRLESRRSGPSAAAVVIGALRLRLTRSSQVARHSGGAPDRAASSSRSVRCRIFPVALRGISSWVRKTISRGRL